MATSNIEWTEMTWNPTTGCTKVSPGCANCYAEVMARRLKAMGIKKYENGFRLQCHEDELELPITWKKPKMIFVNSMSDLFHEDIPIEFIKKVFKVMNDCEHHVFQVLTKRADVLYEYFSLLNWTPNIWMGVSVENNKNLQRIDLLRKIPACIKFVSFEPLLNDLPDLNIVGIDWVIVGGESGPKSRPIRAEWVINIKNQCKKQNTPFFFKQWGGKNKKANGNVLEGKVYQQIPFF